MLIFVSSVMLSMNMNIKTLVFLIMLLHVFFASYLIVFDSTGSMADTLPPDYIQTKMEAAKIAANDFIDSASGDIGLVVFEDCDTAGDINNGGIKLVQTFTTDKTALKTKINAMQPTADTAIADALNEASNYLKATKGSGTIILITDGEETCGGDAVAIAGTIKSNGIAKIHVVGYTIGGTEAEQQAKEIAQAGGGEYYSAQTASELKTALTEIKKKEEGMTTCCISSTLFIALPLLVVAGRVSKKN